MSVIPRIEQEGEISRVILPARRRPKPYPDLAHRIEPVIADWVRAAADWPELALGQARVLAFETPLPGGTTFFVRFWSEPGAPLVCDVPSGHEDSALRAAFLPSAVPWAERNKMVIDGPAHTYRALVPAATELDIETAAAFVLETFIEFIGYAGLTPLVATLAHENRSSWTDTLDSFTEDEVARVFQSFGFRVTPSLSAPDDGIEEPEFVCTKAGIESVIAMMDPAPGSRLYRRVRFDADLPATEKEMERSRKRGQLVTDDMTMVSISGIHAFTGGVTAEWLIERVRDWDKALKEHRREMRREGKRKRAEPAFEPPETIH
jgi:hypothetical protein